MKINNPIYIINKYAIKEFKEFSLYNKNKTYSSLQNEVIEFLKQNPKHIKENLLETEQHILYLQLHDFENFMGIRYGMWGFSIAIISLLFSTNLIKQFSESIIEIFIRILFAFATVSIVNLIRVSRMQKEQLIYLMFKLKCINKVAQSKNNNSKTFELEAYKI